MSEEMIVRNCSPTLAGLKTGSMFSCSVASPRELKEALRAWNRILVKKGLRVVPLRYRGGRALIYIFRPSNLTRDLQNTTAKRLLDERGYNTEALDCCILQLIRNLRKNEDFPHEIGLFLGYPPEDVCGFIENRAEDFKCVGCWKVYGDEKRAQKLFARYKKCTDVYCAKLREGRSVERLTVAS